MPVNAANAGRSVTLTYVEVRVVETCLLEKRGITSCLILRMTIGFCMCLSYLLLYPNPKTMITYTNMVVS